MTDNELLVKYAASALEGIMGNEFVFKKIRDSSISDPKSAADVIAREAFIIASAMMKEHKRIIP